MVVAERVGAYLWKQAGRLWKFLRLVAWRLAAFYNPLAFLSARFLWIVVFIGFTFFRDNVPSLLPYRWWMIGIGIPGFVVFVLLEWGHRQRTVDKRLRDAFLLAKPAEQLKLEDLGLMEASLDTNLPGGRRPVFGNYLLRTATSDHQAGQDEDGGIDQNEVALDEAAFQIDEKTFEGSLVQLLQNGGGFLLLGPMLSGKTLTMYQVVKQMSGYWVVRPDPRTVIPPPALFSVLKNKKVVVLVDDLDRYAENNYDLEQFCTDLHAATQAPYGVAATVMVQKLPNVERSGSGLRRYYVTRLQRFFLSQLTSKQWE